MPRYTGFGLVIDSELELPHLPIAEGDPDVLIRFGTVPDTPRKTGLEEEFAQYLVGAFQVSNGREIVIDPRPGWDTGSLRVVVLGRIMAFLLRQRGWLPVHASGVLINGQCSLFVGPPGAGKSTAAAAFHARGHMVIADDVGPVRVVDGHCVVQSVGSRVRLRDDARRVLNGAELLLEFQRDKYAYDLRSGDVSGLFPVRKLYLLEQGEPIHAVEVPPLLATVLLSNHSFLKCDNAKPEVLRNHLRDCAAVAGVIPIRRLIRPFSLASLPSLVRFVEDDLASLG
jgi:hypothetical protein